MFHLCVAHAVNRWETRRSYAVDTRSTLLNTAKQFSEDITTKGCEETLRASCSARQAAFNLVYSLLKLGMILVDSIQQCVDISLIVVKLNGNMMLAALHRLITELDA